MKRVWLITLIFMNACAKTLNDEPVVKPKKETLRNSKCPSNFAVVGGKKVKSTRDFPFMANSQVCGAAFISPKWLLTAGHCYRYGSPRDNDLLFGALTLNDSKRYKVKRVIEHEKYKALTDKEAYGIEPYDIALIELATPLEKVDVVLLPEKKAKFEEVVTVIGWGLTAPEGKLSPDLLEAQLNVTSNDQCRSVKNKFCTSVKDGSKGICQGDSGGPVLRKLSDGRYEVVGINSTGCGNGLVGTHTEVYAYLDWIDEVSGVSRNSQLNVLDEEESESDAPGVNSEPDKDIECL